MENDNENIWFFSSLSKIRIESRRILSVFLNENNFQAKKLHWFYLFLLSMIKRKYFRKLWLVERKSEAIFIRHVPFWKEIQLITMSWKNESTRFLIEENDKHINAHSFSRSSKFRMWRLWNKELVDRFENVLNNFFLWNWFPFLFEGQFRYWIISFHVGRWLIVDHYQEQFYPCALYCRIIHDRWEIAFYSCHQQNIFCSFSLNVLI